MSHFDHAIDDVLLWLSRTARRRLRMGHPARPLISAPRNDIFLLEALRVLPMDHTFSLLQRLLTLLAHWFAEEAAPAPAPAANSGVARARRAGAGTLVMRFVGKGVCCGRVELGTCSDRPRCVARAAEWAEKELRGFSQSSSKSESTR